jgi:hypothetical protein
VRLFVGWHSAPAGSGGRTTGGPAVFHRRPGLGITNYTPGMVVVRKRVRRLRSPQAHGYCYEISLKACSDSSVWVRSKK